MPGSRIPGYRPRFSRCCVNSGSRVVPWSTSAATADISGGFGDGRFQSGRCRRLCTGVGARGGNHAASETTLRKYQRLYVCICAHGNGARDVMCYQKRRAPCVEEQHHPDQSSRAGTGQFFDIVDHDPGINTEIAVPTRLAFNHGTKTACGTVLSGFAIDHQVGGRLRRSRETHRLYLHTPYKIAHRLQQCGFSVYMANAIGPVEPLPRRVAFICRKVAC